MLGLSAIGLFIASHAAATGQKRTSVVLDGGVEWFRVGCPTVAQMGRLCQFMGIIAVGDDEARQEASRFVEQNCELLAPGETVSVVKQEAGSVLIQIKRKKSPRVLYFSEDEVR